GYYSWLRRGEREEQDHGDLDQAIKEIHKEHRRYYGTRRQQRELRKRGFYVSRRLIRERMKAMGLKVKYIKAFRVTTESDPSASFAPNLLDRDFSPEKANQAWCG